MIEEKEGKKKQSWRWRRGARRQKKHEHNRENSREVEYLSVRKGKDWGNKEYRRTCDEVFIFEQEFSRLVKYGDFLCYRWFGWKKVVNFSQ